MNLGQNRPWRGLAAAALLLCIPVVASAQDFVQSGTYTGDGAPTYVVGGLPFQPDLVIVKAVTNKRAIVKTTGMPDGESKKLDDNKGLEPDRILTLDANGFTVGTHDEVNEAGTDYCWVAMKGGGGNVAIGEYVGNGGVIRKIPVPGVRPHAALVLSAGNDLPVFHHEDMPTWTAFALDGSGSIPSSITSVTTDGFYVSSGDEVNKSGETYYYATWQAAPEAIAYGTYNGNGIPGRDILGLDLDPAYMIIASNAQVPAIHRPASLGGDASLFFTPQASQNNLIQAMWQDGFQIGTDPSVNGDGDSFYWLALANPGAQADLQLSMHVDNPTPAKAEVVALTVTVINAGPAATTGVVVTDFLPAGLIFQNAALVQGSYTESTGVWDVGDLASGQSLELTINALLGAGTAGRTITNSATVTASDLTDPDNLNDVVSLDITVVAPTGADLEVTKTVDNNTPDEGDTITYTVTVTNHGPDPATNVQITDNVPGSLNILTFVPEQGSFNQGTGIWDVGNVNVSDVLALTITAAVKSNTSGSTIVNMAAVSALDQTDPNNANDSDSVDAVVGSVDLQVMKIVDNASPTEGATVTYTVIATNLGPAEATVVRISDVLPTGVTFQSATPDQGNYDEIMGEWSIGTLANAQSQTLTLTATVDGGTTGNTITNTAAVIGVSQSETNSANNTDTAAIVVAPFGGVDLALSHTVDDASPNVGDVVTYTVTVLNNGPTGASGIVVADLLPPEVSFAAALTNKGTYDDASGLWTIGDLDNGFQAVLNVQATVTAAAIGATVTHSADISAADQTDPDSANNSALATFIVASSDLQLTQTVDSPTPAVGDTVTYELTVGNSGPNPASAILVTDILPAGISFVSATPLLGSHDSGTGIWNVGGLNPGLNTSLSIQAVVLPAGAGTTITNTAEVTADQADPNAANNTDSASITVDGTDLALDLVADVAVALEGSEVNLTLTITNNGPQAATAIEVTQLVPAGFVLDTDTPSQGGYIEGSGLWTVGDLALGASATLNLAVTVAAGTAGSDITNEATITGADPVDSDLGNNTSTMSVTIWAGVPSNENILWPLVGASATVHPGASTQQEVLTFAFANRGSQPDTLHALTLTNLTVGSGTPAEMAEEWQTLRAIQGSSRTAAGDDFSSVATGRMVGSTVLFGDLEWAVAAGDSLFIKVYGGASLAARDGTLLQVGIAAAAHAEFNGPYTLIGEWPAVSGQVLEVDGFVAAQAHIAQVAGELLAVGSERNLVFAVDLPGNGYVGDSLYGIALKNSGTAEIGDDITRIEFWADEGDTVFSAATDIWLGAAVYSGERWQLSGLDVKVPTAGRRIYATADIAETADPRRNIRLGLPVGYSPAIEMYSGNDGPVDVAMVNARSLGFNANDRIILSDEPLADGVVSPGSQSVRLLQFVLNNTYSDSRLLDELTFTNTTVAAGADQAQQDATCQQVQLWLDANNNGELDDLFGAGGDSLLASGSYSGGRVTFDGLNRSLAPGAKPRLIVAANIGLMTAADGNLIKGQISSMADIRVENSTIVAAWPLQSGVEWLVNGMTADQISIRDISVLTLGPGEGPVLAMDVTIPSNGYATDELTGITLFNEGTAGASDIQTAELWADGIDGVFDAGPDDVFLGTLTLNGENWTNNALSHPLPVGGQRLFVSLEVSSTPQDSVTVKLSVPTGGITVLSGNDGPLDNPVSGNGTLVISTSPLRTTVSFATAATNTGQSGVINMAVVNAGSEIVTDLDPYIGFLSGDGLLVVGTQTPVTIPPLAPGAETDISWSFSSIAPGVVVMEGNISGKVNGDQDRQSIATSTAPHRIFTPVPELELYPTANLPFSINRGQQGLVPLTLTLKNPGDADVADAVLNSLRLRFLEAVDGPVIDPFALVERIVISEGTNIYYDSESDPSIAVGTDVELAFSQPAVITGSEPITLGLRLDLRLNSTVPSFLVSIEEGGWLQSNDAVNGDELNVVAGTGSFPVRTGQATLVAPASGLNVAMITLDEGSAVPGQVDILLAEVELTQSVVDDNSSSIDVGRLAFKFLDAAGAPLNNPSQWLSRLTLRSAFQEHFAGVPTVESDSVVVLQLSAPVTISGTSTLVLRLMGDVAGDSPLGQITPMLGSVDHIDARDGNMNNPVLVVLTTGPEGPLLHILGPAVALEIGGVGTMPVEVSRGTRNLTALDLTLTNPGAPGTSYAAGDTIELEFFDAARQPLDPGPYLDRLQILRGPNLMGQLIDPAAADGVVALSVAGGQLAPGQSTVLRVSLDFKPDCPTGTIEVVLNNNGIRAIDSITGATLETYAAPGVSLPISSGVATLVIPADELLVAGTSLMPPLLAPQVQGTEVMELVFSNPAASGSGGIELNGLTLAQSPAKAANAELGRLLDIVRLRQGNRYLASVGDLATSASSVTLVPDSLLTVAAGESVTLVVEVLLKSDAPPGQVQFVLEQAGVAAGPPGGGGLEIRVLPVSGSTFPFATETGNIGKASLAGSYANFPNPFAAGRESTTFVFSLLQDAQVNLRIMTPHGELVATVLQDVSRPAGLYQSDLWQGLNGNGIAVHNGVYLAELVVQYSDGSRERILRKVAVVR